MKADSHIRSQRDKLQQHSDLGYYCNGPGGCRTTVVTNVMTKVNTAAANVITKVVANHRCQQCNQGIGSGLLCECLMPYKVLFNAATTQEILGRIEPVVVGRRDQ